MKIIINENIVNQYKKEIRRDKKLDDAVIRRKIQALIKICNKNVINDKYMYTYKGNRITVDVMTNKIVNAKFVGLERSPKLLEIYEMVGLNRQGNKLVYNNQLPTAKEIKSVIKNNKYNIKFTIDENQSYPIRLISNNDEFIAKLDDNNMFEVQHLNDKYFLRGYNKNKLHSHLQRRYGKLEDMLESINNHTRFKLEQDYRNNQLLSLLGISSLQTVKY